MRFPGNCVYGGIYQDSDFESNIKLGEFKAEIKGLFVVVRKSGYIANYDIFP